MDLAESYNKIWQRRRHFLVLVPVFLSSLILLILSYIWIAVHFVNFEGNVLIRFDYYRGIEMGGIYTLYETLSVGLAVLFLDVFLSAVLFKTFPSLSYLISFAALIFSVLIFMAVASIISVN